MTGIPRWFMPLWCLVMPITSLLIVPSIQGTIPAYLMAFASLALVLPSREDGWFESQRARYLGTALLLAGIWLFLLCGSQLAHIISDRHNFGDLALIRDDDRGVLLRPALFTQTLYLAACICTALFFRFFFREEWMRYVFWGAWFLALYGIYEWLFFLVFKEPGDFIANRMYGDHPGSWSQTVQVGPFTLLRIKSTFGEPSWFSAAVVPYFFLALEYRRRLLAVALLFCIVFSTSTSAFVGYTFAIVLYVVLKRKVNVSLVIAVLLFAAAFAVLYFLFPNTFHEMFAAKLRGENLSGQGRMEHAAAAADAENTLTSPQSNLRHRIRLPLWRRLLCDSNEHGVDRHGGILLRVAQACVLVASRWRWNRFQGLFGNALRALLHFCVGVISCDDLDVSWAGILAS